MNREIRFQVVENNEIVAEEFSDPQFNGGAWCHYLLADPEQVIHYGGYVQMGFTAVIRRQYTGLKDKNGIEIYEGDIVTCEGFEKLELRVKDNYEPVVSFDWHGACIKREGYFVRLDMLHNWEVIGNIYENKELLNEH